MKEYVLVYVENTETGSIVILYKNRPIWQAGLINLCGGLIEEGETVLEAAVRELKEESGIVIDKNCEYIGELGKIVDGDSIIHCVAVFLNKSVILTTDEDQVPEWVYWDNIKSFPKLIPNLKVIIPLMHMRLDGWEVVDEYRSKTSALHEIRVKIPDLR